MSTRTTLLQLAHGRSGDKGAHTNIAIIARTQHYYPLLLRQLTADSVAAYFAALHPTRVVRYELPRLWALNFVLYDVLGKGGSLSLRGDAQGKALAQALLLMEVDYQP